MKTNKLLINGVAIFLTVLFSSYSIKRNTEKNVDDDSTQILLNCTKNPYDYVGEIHIALLDSVIKGKISIADVPELCKKAFNSRKDFSNHKIEFNDSTKKLFEQATQRGKTIREIKTRDSLNSFMNNKVNKLPQTWKPYLQRVNQLIGSEFADTISLRYVFSFIDKDILSDPKLKEGEKAYLLSYSAVAKYSYKYFKFDKNGKPKKQLFTMTPLKKH